MQRTIPKFPLLLLGFPLLLSACAASGTGNQTPPRTRTLHRIGYVAGAQENSEPQNGLLTFDRETGESQLLSLLTDQTTDAGTFGPVDAVQQDGRYALVTTQDGVKVFDTGAWTVDHGDHVHYYSSTPGPVGDITIPDAGVVVRDGGSIAVLSESGGYTSIPSAKTWTHARWSTRANHQHAAQGHGDPLRRSLIASTAGDGTAPGGVDVRDAGDLTVLSRQRCAGSSSMPPPGWCGAGLHGRGPVHHRG